MTMTIAAPALANPTSPVVLDVVGPSRVDGAGEIELTATIERESPNLVPLVLRVVTPDGATLLGPAEETIVDAHEPRLSRRFRLSLARVPEGDVIVTLETRATSYGVHAEVVYRFGRPEVTRRHAPLGPMRYGLGGVRLGRPVLLGPADGTARRVGLGGARSRPRLPSVPARPRVRGP